MARGMEFDLDVAEPDFFAIAIACVLAAKLSP